MPGSNKTLKMNNEEDQKYYDAIVMAGIFDIHDISSMRDLAVVQNGKITYPFYDRDLESLAPVYDRDGNVTGGMEVPHEKLLVSLLPKYAQEGKLVFFKPLAKSSEPYALTFQKDGDGNVTASLDNTSLYASEKRFPAPAEPTAPSVGDRIKSFFSFGGRFFRSSRDRVARYGEEMRRYRADLEKHAEKLEMRKVLLAGREERDNADAAYAEYRNAKSFRDEIAQFDRRLDEFYGAEPKKTSGVNTILSGSIDPETRIDVPEGMTTKQVENVVRFSMMTENAFSQYTKEIDDREAMIQIASGHVTEDIIADRESIHTFFNGSITAARKTAKEAIGDYAKNGDPDKLGSIIGQTAWIFANDTTYCSTADLSVKRFASLKNNGHVYDLLAKHPDIREAAMKHGLTEKVYGTLRAHKAICEIHEKGMEARETLFGGKVVSDKSALADKVADHLLDKMTSRLLVRITKERGEKIDALSDKYAEEGMKNGVPAAELSQYVQKNVAPAFNHTEAPGRVLLLGDPENLVKIREGIKGHPAFTELMDELGRDVTDCTKVLSSTAKMNRIMNALSADFIDNPELEERGSGISPAAPEKKAEKEPSVQNEAEKTGPGAVSETVKTGNPPCCESVFHIEKNGRRSHGVP